MERLVELSVSKMLAEGIISEKQRAIVVYGLDILYFSILSFLSFAVIGVAFDVMIETVVFFLVFIFLQSFGGGYHCNTHLGCWVLTLLGYVASVFGVARWPAGILWPGAIALALVFIKIAPVEHKNAPFSEGFRKKMRKVVLKVYAASVLLAFVLLLKGVGVGRVVLAAIILSGVSIASAWVRSIVSK